jgi:hypothetical protein
MLNVRLLGEFGGLIAASATEKNEKTRKTETKQSELLTFIAITNASKKIGILLAHWVTVVQSRIH